MFILSAFILFQAASPLPASQVSPPDPVPPARIAITTPFPVHLGSVGPRDIREAVYGLRNIHSRPFHVRVLDLSLGLSLDEGQLKEPLQPGETRNVRVKVDPSGLEGFIKGAVRLGTDDPAQPNYILRYDMVVRPEIAVDSERKSLGEVAPHETPEVRFHFTREGGDPLKLVMASELPPHFTVDLVPNGAEADLRITLHLSRLKAGTVAGLEVLKVATNGPKQPLFTLYLDWRLAAPVIPTPSRLVFGDLKTTLLGLELTSRDGHPFRISKAEIQGPGFALIDQPGPESVRHTLRIRRTGHNSEAMLVLECSNLDAPLKVPLRFLDPAAKSTSPENPGPPQLQEHRY